MGSILVRGLDQKTIKYLKERRARHDGCRSAGGAGSVNVAFPTAHN